ncbi:hypothetical protein, partial [Empedobacter sp. 189-2]|uniref:hypothetical protein n=1 Tax=Empedobacter sp. 189-2 TaxID=2746724 RepID=UPI002578073B
VETRNGIAHPIAHIGNVPLSIQDGMVNYVVDVRYLPRLLRCPASSLVIKSLFRNIKDFVFTNFGLERENILER